jgi:glycosyltransferase involved in cell wall biosynthesis
MNQPKLVSVIIPVYNGELYLAEALDSVFAQDYRPIEVIVVDDGSTDDTAAVAKRYSQVHYFHQTNQGPPAARNTGLNNCKGELIALLDADDLWVPGKLSTQTAFLETHPQACCVIGRMKNFLQEGIPRPSWVNDSMFTDNPVAYSLGSMLVHRWVFETVGQFNTSNQRGDNIDWLIRLNELKLIVYRMPEVLLLRRIHSNNLSQKYELKNQARLRFLKEAIDRKRKTQSSAQ